MEIGMFRNPGSEPIQHSVQSDLLGRCRTPSVGSGSDGEIHAPLPTLTGRHRSPRWRKEQRMGTRPFGRPSPDESAISGQAPARQGAPTAALKVPLVRPALAEPVAVERAGASLRERRAPLA